MTNDQRLVTAYFTDREAAENAFAKLPEHGIAQSDVSAIGRRGEITPEGPDGSKLGGEDMPSPVAKAAKAGAAVGAAVGVLGGALLTVGFFIFPAAGLVIVGPLVGALTGAGIAGATGTVRNALMSAGMTEAEAAAVEQRVMDGGLVLAVNTEASRADQVMNALRKLGGEPLAIERVAGVR